MADDPQTRREFVVRTISAAGLAVIGTSAVLLTRCGGTAPTSPAGSQVEALPTITGTVANGAVSVTIAAGSPLAATGGVALVRSTAGDVLVTRTGDGTFSALSAICTHQACEITGHSGGTFVCPCHGSQYDLNGTVLVGPAVVNLPRYATSFANGVLTIGPA